MQRANTSPFQGILLASLKVIKGQNSWFFFWSLFKIPFMFHKQWNRAIVHVIPIILQIPFNLLFNIQSASLLFFNHPLGCLQSMAIHGMPAGPVILQFPGHVCGPGSQSNMVNGQWKLLFSPGPSSINQSPFSGSLVVRDLCCLSKVHAPLGHLVLGSEETPLIFSYSASNHLRQV